MPPAIGPDRHDIGLEAQMRALEHISTALSLIISNTISSAMPEDVRKAIRYETDCLLDEIQVKIECCRASRINAMRRGK